MTPVKETFVALVLLSLQAEMQLALQSFYMRLEAVLQHRRLELLVSHGFLKREFLATNFSLKGTIPKAITKALETARKCI